LGFGRLSPADQETPKMPIDISEARFEQRTPHLSDEGLMRSRSRARFHLP